MWWENDNGGRKRAAGSGLHEAGGRERVAELFMRVSGGAGWAQLVRPVASKTADLAGLAD